MTALASARDFAVSCNAVHLRRLSRPRRYCFHSKRYCGSCGHVTTFCPALLMEVKACSFHGTRRTSQIRPKYSQACRNACLFRRMLVKVSNMKTIRVKSIPRRECKKPFVIVLYEAEVWDLNRLVCWSCNFWDEIHGTRSRCQVGLGNVRGTSVIEQHDLVALGRIARGV